MRRSPVPFAVLALAAALAASPARAQFMTGRGRIPDAGAAIGERLTSEKLLAKVGFDQHLGARLPLDTPLRDENGAAVRLGDFFGERPVLLVFSYYTCPMLCPQVANGVASSLKGMNLRPGTDFEVVFVSFDPHDSAAAATERRDRTVARYASTASAAGWHFLTGDAEAIARLTGTAGFRYTFDEASRQFAHASGIVVVTPQGVLARYLFGIEYEPKDIRLALVEAGEGRLGGLADKLLLLCFHYDASLGKYTPAITVSLKIGAALTLAALVGLVGMLLSRERHRRGATAGGTA